MTGTTIAQAIPIAVTPILTRLYTPEDFGLLGLFVAITVILGAVSSGRYELAIMLPDKDEEAINIAALALIITIIFSLLLLLPAFLLNQKISNILDNQEIRSWLYFIPFVVLMIGLFNVLNYLNTRKKLYRDIAKANVYKSVGMSSVQLGVGLIKTGATGLISGQIVAQIISNFRLLKNTISNYDLKEVKITDLKRLAKRYIDFPKFSTWSALSNTGSRQLPVMLLSGLSSLSNVGYFSVANRLLMLPITLIGSSFGQVFFQASSTKKNKEELKQITEEVQKKLTLLAVIPFALVFATGDILTAFILGIEWRDSGVYMQFLSFWLYIVFITSPLTKLYTILERQKEAMYFNVIILFIRVGAILFGYLWLSLNDLQVIILYAVLSGLMWLIWLARTMQLVSERWFITTLRSVLIFFTISCSFLLIRFI
jgi:O-antigen/teichoic acid export membrane protein